MSHRYPDIVGTFTCYVCITVQPGIDYVDWLPSSVIALYGFSVVVATKLITSSSLRRSGRSGLVKHFDFSIIMFLFACQYLKPWRPSRTKTPGTAWCIKFQVRHDLQQWIHRLRRSMFFWFQCMEIFEKEYSHKLMIFLIISKLNSLRNF